MGKFYITTSIPYVNSEPHIGFGMELLMADVLARYHRKLGDEVLFSTGTDEHGVKVAEKAAELKLSPKEFTDQVSQHFRHLLKLLNISSDRFVRTTDPGHEQRAQIIWKNLRQHIYKGTYSGWYCVGHEAYFAEEVVKANKGTCPDHNRPYEQLKEENYFFKLSAFAPQIKQAIETDQLRIVPSSRKHEILSLINTGLEDTSISRPKDKIDWGIPVPGDDSQVMYVWFEALMNYITVLGYPEHADFKKYWPADVQIIGKDILRFHAAVWPAMLMGLGLPIQKNLYVHGFITVDGKKMSKTLGNVVAPKAIVEKYGVDALRYFFLRHIPSYGDGDFSWNKIREAFNNELADQLGNAVSRTSAMAQKYLKGVIGDIPEPEHDIGAYRRAMDLYRFDQALEEIWQQVRGLNQYIDQTKPWEIAKTNDEAHLRETLAYIAGGLLQIAVLLEPFMPETAAKIQKVFGSGMLKPLEAPLFLKEVKPAGSKA
jgi:methionyl-tRNA synthetase